MAADSPTKPWWRRWFGNRSERAAARFLRRQGHRIVARNWRCSLGELDLVTLDRGCLVFVEVRARKSAAFGGAAFGAGPIDGPEDSDDHEGGW